MLDKHLIAKTRPLARKENVLFWGNYRVTVLTDRLFRLEYSAHKKFRDGATQSVFFRDHDAQTYSILESENRFVVDTGVCKLIVAPSRVDCRIVIDGKERAIDNKDNLLGTYRTLDGCDGSWCTLGGGFEISLGTGVCSRTGVAVVDDSLSLTLGEDGAVCPERADGTDEYIFAFGDDYRGAVKALYSITGNTPILPRYALGNWWSRYYRYTDKEYLRVMESFLDRDIPLTVATVDMDWHYSEEEMKRDIFGAKKSGEIGGIYGEQTGWTGYSWNKNLFPDYKDFLKKLQDRGLQITLNLHPAEGVAWWEDSYEEMANAVGVDATTHACIPFDIASSTFINAYFKILHRPYEKDGVSFWWIDWQQGTSSEMDGLDPLWSLNHYHYLDQADSHEYPLILSRYSGVGAHRYPLGFSGDTFITWKTLDYLPYFTATASNIGYTWWSHDIGGHQGGEMNEELYLRHLQYGVFSPINRLHCTAIDTMRKEPWLYGGAGRVAEEYLRLRHALIPYLYTEAYRTHTDGLALVQPLYYEWKDKQAYTYDREYLFGQNLLVIPAITPTEQDGYTHVKAWLPEGVWTDIFTGVVHRVGRGGKETTLVRKPDEYPVFARAGAILPLSADKGNGCGAPKNLELRVYSGKGEYTLYEDGAFTKIAQAVGAGTNTLQLFAYGDKSKISDTRTVLVRFENIRDGKITVREDGKEIPVMQEYKSCACVRFAFDKAKAYEVIVQYEEETAQKQRTWHAEQVLMKAQGTHSVKWELYQRLREIESAEEYLATVEQADLPIGVKMRLKEVL